VLGEGESYLDPGGRLVAVAREDENIPEPGLKIRDDLWGSRDPLE